MLDVFAESCSFFGSDRNELCFKVVPTEIRVKVGNKRGDGTDNDVTVQICSDRNVNECCTTPPLKSLIFDDWSKGGEENWGERYLGDCKGKKFNVSNNNNNSNRYSTERTITITTTTTTTTTTTLIITTPTAAGAATTAKTS